MSQTIDDFRNFYAPTKTKEEFSLAEESQKVIDLISFEKIVLELIVIEDTKIFNYKNEYKQVLLNLLTNAKDVLLERNIASPKITIEVNDLQITVSDNAGGIEHENMQKIFEPYFTTKEQGLGIGLYMSKMIIKKNMSGVLSVKNNKDGAVFSLDFR
jgi:C4-dicarboxylate-specific signal transduction histidine kinase